MHANDLFRRSGGLSPPADIVSTWPTPNHTDPETHGDSGPIIVIAFLVCSVLVYFARMWARIRLSNNVGLDDYILGIAMLPLIGAAIAVVFGRYSTLLGKLVS